MIEFSMSMFNSKGGFQGHMSKSSKCAWHREFKSNMAVVGNLFQLKSFLQIEIIAIITDYWQTFSNGKSQTTVMFVDY